MDRRWHRNAKILILCVAVFTLARDLFDPDTGLLAAALGTISPMFVLLSGTLLSHATSIAALTLVAWASVRARRPYEAHHTRFALLAGALVGLSAIMRPWTAL